MSDEDKWHAAQHVGSKEAADILVALGHLQAADAAGDVGGMTVWLQSILDGALTIAGNAGRGLNWLARESHRRMKAAAEEASDRAAEPPESEREAR